MCQFRNTSAGGKRLRNGRNMPTNGLYAVAARHASPQGLDQSCPALQSWVIVFLGDIRPGLSVRLAEGPAPAYQTALF
jgi:hypothetical protein